MNLRPPAYLIVALIGVLGIVGQWAGPEAFPWWRLIAAALLLALLYEWLRVRGYRIKVRSVAHGPLHLGREEVLGVEFHNPERIEISMQFVPGLPSAVRGPTDVVPLSVGAGDHQFSQFAVQALELGQHPWAKIPTRVRGPLGLAWWPIHCPTNTRVPCSRIR